METFSLAREAINNSFPADTQFEDLLQHVAINNECFVTNSMGVADKSAEDIVFLFDVRTTPMFCLPL